MIRSGIRFQSLLLILILSFSIPGRFNSVKSKNLGVNPPDIYQITNKVDVKFPIRAAFYYPWFPQSWEQAGYRHFSHYTPSLGYYSQDDEKIIEKHIAAMQYAKIRVGIASWWGQHHYTNDRLPLLLKVGTRTGFLWSVYIENEGYSNPSIESIQSDLKYIQQNYGSSDAYLKINGRIVVFVYGDPSETCSMVDRWTKANSANAYLVLKVFPGYRDCKNQPDAWHQYAPDLTVKQVDSDSFTISPGFSMIGKPTPFLQRDLNRWSSAIQEMNASSTKFHLITTFNEWGEGTAVESANEWASNSGYGLYLDALHKDGLDQSISAASVNKYNFGIASWNGRINQE